MSLGSDGNVFADIPEPDQKYGALPDITGWEISFPVLCFHLTVI